MFAKMGHFTLGIADHDRDCIWVNTRIEHHPRLPRLIWHEQQHFVYFALYDEAQNKWQRLAAVIKNNIWDTADDWVLAWYFVRWSFCFLIGAFIFAIVFSGIIIASIALGIAVGLPFLFSIFNAFKGGISTVTVTYKEMIIGEDFG
jgi:hypothetical protein